MKKKTASEYAIEKYEEDSKSLLPLVFKNSADMDAIDRRVDTRNFPGIFAFWKKKTYEGKEGIEAISKELSLKRNISKSDKNFILGIKKELENKKIPWELSRSLGIIYMINNTLSKLDKEKISIEMKLPVLFWVYLNFVECSLAEISIILLKIAKAKKDTKFIESFDEAKEKGDNLLPRRLRQFVVKIGILKENEKENEDYFLNNLGLRNEIAHGLIFYDSERKKIIRRGNKKLTKKEFLTELDRVRDFLMELLFQLNGESSNLTQPIEKLRDKYAKQMQKIVRSGISKEKKSKMKFPWE